MKIVSFFKYATFALALTAMATSCSSDDNEPEAPEQPETTPADPTTVQFIVTSSDKALDLKAPAVMRVFTDLTKSQSNVQVVGNENSTAALDAFTQMSWNKDTKTFTGYIYGRGAITLGGAGLRTFKVEGDKLAEVGEATTVENFGNTGTFGNYSYAAQISNPYVMRVERKDNATNSDNIHLASLEKEYAIDGVMPAVTEIVDRGNNEVALTLYYSNRDSSAVAFADYDLNISSVVYDNRIGACYGAQRSVRYSQAASDDEGNIYVFSGQTANNNLIGALKIAKGSKQFDANYHFNIGQANGGYRFRKVYHISGDAFLLECFPQAGAVENMSTSGKMAVVNMSKQTFTWVKGFPSDPSTISIGFPDSYDGKIYVPVSGPSGMNGGGSTATVTPTLYAIDTDGNATALMTFASSELLKGITILK